MATTDTYSPGEVAKQLGCSVQTIRRWCNTFYPYLSEGASPPTGQRRKLTPNDVEVLKRVHELAGRGFTFAQIAPMLEHTPEPEKTPATTDMVPVLEKESSHEASTALVSVLADVVDQRDQLRELEEVQRELVEQVQSLQEDRQQRTRQVEFAVRALPYLTLLVILLLVAVGLLLVLR